MSAEDVSSVANDASNVETHQEIKSTVDWDRDVAPLLNSERLASMHLTDATSTSPAVKIPNDIIEGAKSGDRAFEKLRIIAQNLPYPIESNAYMQGILDHILLRIVQCVKARDFDRGLVEWDNHLHRWLRLKYPMPKPKRIALIKLYYGVATQPCMSRYVTMNMIISLMLISKSKKNLTISDLRLPWKPVYEILSKNLFVPRRVPMFSHLTKHMAVLVSLINRFFHPAAINEMLETILPSINGTDINAVLPTQFYLLSFLPKSHPQSYLPMLFHFWQTFNSTIFDKRMLEFLAQLAEMHLDPTISDPKRIEEIPDDARSEGEGRPRWAKGPASDEPWTGLFKDVGIFSEEQWEYIMCKCLATMDIPLKDSGPASTGGYTDGLVRKEVKGILAPEDPLDSLAMIMVYSMTSGSPVSTAEEGIPRALKSFTNMMSTIKHCFHPVNPGASTDRLTEFISNILRYFNKRWHAEQKEDCKTPQIHRLTNDQKHELVIALQPLAMIAIYSDEEDTVENAMSCLRTLAFLEPEFILPPVIKEASSSLKSLVESERTPAALATLSSISLALVSHEHHTVGANQLLDVLFLVLPGIDSNDLKKTCLTAGFIAKTARHIKIEDNASLNSPPAEKESDNIDLQETESQDFSPESESTTFSAWTAQFFDRVILFANNLPLGIDENEHKLEGPEDKALKAILSACNQVIIHLSDSLYDKVLEQIFNYATLSTSSDTTFVKRIVQPLTAANPKKVLARFLPTCIKNIEVELDYGASSLRTISAHTPIPSDSKLLWNLAVLSGIICDGDEILQYKDEIKRLLKLLSKKTLSKKGYDQSGSIFRAVLQELTTVYPKDARFLNPDVWQSNSSQQHLWGQKYMPQDIKINWHIPSIESISFVLEIFHEIVQPLLEKLEELLKTDSSPSIKDWRNDFCRHLTIISKAFSGISTVAKANLDAKAFKENLKNADYPILPEMAALFTLQKSAFVLSDPDDPKWKYITSLQSQFGEVLHKASVVLQAQDDMHVVDVVDLLLCAIRSFVLDYGRLEKEFLNIRRSITRDIGRSVEYDGEKSLPRSQQLEKLRIYDLARQSADTNWKLQGDLENYIIGDIVEWSMSSYVTVRKTAQKLLEDSTQIYNGVRHQATPKLIQNMKAGNESSRVKGALWTFKLEAFSDYLQFASWHHSSFLKGLFQCQFHTEASVQEQVASVFEESVHSWSSFKPSISLHKDGLAVLHMTANNLDNLLTLAAKDNDLIEKFTAEQTTFQDNYRVHHKKTVDLVCQIASSPQTHWIYATDALVFLLLHISYEEAVPSFQIEYFFQMTCSPETVKQNLAKMGLMTAMQHSKWRSFSLTPQDLIIRKPKNPLCTMVQITPEQQDTHEYLQQSTQRMDLGKPVDILFQEKPNVGWLVWPTSMALYRTPCSKAVDERMNKIDLSSSDQAIIDTVRQAVNNEEFWSKLAWTFSLEKPNESAIVNELNMSCVKSIFQMLQDEPFKYLEPTLMTLLQDTDMNKQRAGAEFLAGILGAMKHWPIEKQQQIWAWFTPQFPQLFGKTVRPATLFTWATFFQYLFQNRDPRHLQPLLDYMLEMFEECDFNSKSSFNIQKWAIFVNVTFTSIGWRSEPWLDRIINKYWGSLTAEHDTTQGYIARMLFLSHLMKLRPNTSVPTAEMFIKDCETAPLSYDLMGTKGNYNGSRVTQLAENFPKWREERLPGDRVLQSTYDRVGLTVCKWLVSSLRSIQPTSSIPYILPLMPEILRFSELRDNPELSEHGSVVLDTICSIILPKEFVTPVIDVALNALKTPLSWRLHLNALSFLTVLYIRQNILIGEDKVLEILDAVCHCLVYKVMEIRNSASSFLAEMLKVAGSKYTMMLKARFVQEITSIEIPDSCSPGYTSTIQKLHGNILGLCGVIDSNPYSVDSWTPSLIADVLSLHTFDPFPISTTVQKWALKFKESHRDTWHEDSNKFTKEQLYAFETLVSGSSYYA